MAEADKAGWKRRLILRLYIWFTRWCVFNLEIYPPSGQDARFCPYCRGGEIFWYETQGGYFARWKAEQDAAKYKFGYVTRVPLDCSYRSETIRGDQVFVNSPAVDQYRRNGLKHVPIEEHDLRQLKEATIAGAAAVAQHKTAATK